MKEDISLCEAIDEKTTKINSLRSQLEQERKEKLQLCDSIREVEVSSRSHEHAAEDLRAEVVDLKTVIGDIGKNSKTCVLSRNGGALKVAQGAQGDDADVAQLPRLYFFV